MLDFWQEFALNRMSVNLLKKIRKLKSKFCIQITLVKMTSEHAKCPVYYDKLPIENDEKNGDDYVTSDLDDFNVDLSKYMSEENAKSLDKWIGRCGRDYENFKNIVILYGSGSNGKTTIIKNIESYVGSKNVLRRSVTDNTLIPSEYKLVILKYQPGDNLNELSKLYKYDIDFIIETNHSVNIPIECIPFVKVIKMTNVFKNGISKSVRK